MPTRPLPDTAASFRPEPARSAGSSPQRARARRSSARTTTAAAPPSRLTRKAAPGGREPITPGGCMHTSQADSPQVVVHPDVFKVMAWLDTFTPALNAELRSKPTLICEGEP